MWGWRNIGGIALDVLGILLCWGGLDCLATGWRDLRHGDRDYTRRIGLYVVLTGIGLCAAGGLAVWGGGTLRGRFW
jgi:hypothetical protein